MNSVARLIKSKTISFTEELITNYKQLKLNEQETLVLILLYRKLDKSDNIISINELANSMTLSIEELSDVVISLVNRGFIDLESVEAEAYNLDGAINALAQLLDVEDDSSNSLKNRQDILSQIVLYVETTYAKLCSPADLQVINSWLDSGYSFDEIKKAILDSLKAKKLHLKYADAILASRKTNDRVEVEYDEEIRKMLDSMYVKK